MFTGIVEEKGSVISVWNNPSGARLTLSAKKVLKGVTPGDSIAVNGVCLTIIRYSQKSITVELSPETLKRSNLGNLQTGSGVHLERALQLSSPIGGHFVQGHVDGTGTVQKFKKEGNTLVMFIGAGADLLHYLVPKGFVALDGVSLTVIEVKKSHFSVTLVPFTREQTYLADRPVGYRVNMEVDILGKYVKKFLTNSNVAGDRITMDFLAKNGFK